MSNTDSTEKKTENKRFREAFDFSVLMKVSGDRKRLYSVTHAPNKSGMCRVASLDQGEVKIVHQRGVKNLQQLCVGKAGEFFDRFDDLVNEARLVLPKVEDKIYSPTFGVCALQAMAEYEIPSYNSELLINYYFYMNQLLAMSKKEDKTNDTIQLENE